MNISAIVGHGGLINKVEIRAVIRVDRDTRPSAADPFFFFLVSANTIIVAIY